MKQNLGAIIGAAAVIIAAIIGIIFGKTIIQVVVPPSGVTPTSTAVARTATANNPPTATPSPTPTLITITKNLDIACISCVYKLDLKLTTIVIDTTKQMSTWNFTITNNDTPHTFSLSSFVLEDNTGQKHQGGGPASTDRWNMSSGQSVQTYTTFNVVHGTKYLLNIEGSGIRYQTETITF